MNNSNTDRKKNSEVRIKYFKTNNRNIRMSSKRDINRYLRGKRDNYCETNGGQKR